MEHYDDLRFNYFTLTNHSNALMKEVEAVRKRSAKRWQADKELPSKSARMHSTISRMLKVNKPAPMAFLKRNGAPGQAGPTGSYTTDPAEIDCILHFA